MPTSPRVSRRRAEALQASPRKGHPGAVMSLLYAALELVFLLYIYVQRTGASSDFDPRVFGDQGRYECAVLDLWLFEP